jgi:hypothetical protein
MFSGPGMIVGGAVMTGVGAAMMMASTGATTPGSDQWQDDNSQNQAANAAGLVFVVGGVIMMGWGLMATMSGR